VLPESEVVLDGPDLVAIALDANRGLVRLGYTSDLLQDGAGVIAEQRRVEVEEDSELLVALAGVARRCWRECTRDGGRRPRRGGDGRHREGCGLGRLLV
jgi:hypothetical protein